MRPGQAGLNLLALAAVIAPLPGVRAGAFWRVGTKSIVLPTVAPRALEKLDTTWKRPSAKRSITAALPRHIQTLTSVFTVVMSPTVNNLTTSHG